MSTPVPDRRRSPDLNPVNLLLLVPIVLSLAVPLYNQVDPDLAGLPFFYWFQLAIIPIGVLCTMVVYRATTRRENIERRIDAERDR
jgi:Protein of unknown function (DUF3311)